MRSLSRIARACVLWILVVSGARAQAVLPLQVDVDHGVFAFDSTRSLVELYLGFNAQSLSFRPDSMGFRTELPLVVSILNRGVATPVWTDTSRMSFAVPDTGSLAPGRFFVHQIRTALAPGAYEVRVRIPADSRSGRRELEIRRDVAVASFAANTDRAALSEIELASAIGAGQDRGDPFYKNGLIVRPNPGRLYGQGMSRLTYYAEVYRPGQASPSGTHYTVRAFVGEANRPQPVAGLERRQERPVQPVDVLVGSFDVAALASGSYTLWITVLGGAGEVVAEQSSKFFVYNPQVEQRPVTGRESAFAESAYATMPEPDVDQALQQIEIIANERERRQARAIRDLDEKRRYLKEFWDKRNPTPGAAVNTFREEFYRRLQVVEERYAGAFGPGWKTDRGRVLVKYGNPTSVEPHLYEQSLMPHEIWVYDNIPGEGDALFVFADRDGFGQFELIHSTVRGERSLVNWEQELVR